MARYSPSPVMLAAFSEGSSAMGHRLWPSLTAVLLALMLGMGSPLSASSSPPASPSRQAQPAMTMCAYLDVVRNLGDLKQRIGQWERGDANSRGIALEKVERLEIVFDMTGWPTAQLAAEANVVKNGVEPVRAALEADNLDAAKQAATQVGDHDLTHAFY